MLVSVPEGYLLGPWVFPTFSHRGKMAGLPNGIHVCGVIAGQNGPWNVPVFSKGNRSGRPPKTCRSCWVQTLSGSDFPLKKGGWGGLWIFFVVFMVEIKPPQVPNTKNNIEYRVNGHETCRNINPGYCCLPVLSVASWKLTLFTIIYIHYGWTFQWYLVCLWR